jgi:hypothetical protein
METLLLICLQISSIINRINEDPNLTQKLKDELVLELIQASKDNCSIDANLLKEQLL